MGTHVLVLYHTGPVVWVTHLSGCSGNISAAQVHLARAPLAALCSLALASLHDVPLSASVLLIRWPGHLWRCDVARIRLTPTVCPCWCCPSPVWLSLLQAQAA